MNIHTARPACWTADLPDASKAYGPPAKQMDGTYCPWPSDARWCGNATADYWQRHIALTPGCLCCGRGYEARVQAGEGA